MHVTAPCLQFDVNRFLRRGGKGRLGEHGHHVEVRQRHDRAKARNHADGHASSATSREFIYIKQTEGREINIVISAKNVQDELSVPPPPLESDCADITSVGATVGLHDGAEGWNVGPADGSTVGSAVGSCVGAVGRAEGAAVGRKVGAADGFAVGHAVGSGVGAVG